MREIKPPMRETYFARDRKTEEERLLEEVMEEVVSLPINQLHQVIKDAIKDKEDIFLIYNSNDQNKITERRITPRRIYGSNMGLTLEAYCHLRGTDRNFRLRDIPALQVMRD